MSAILPHQFLDAVHAFFMGYSWGLAAAGSENRKSINHLIREGKVQGLPEEAFREVNALFLDEDWKSAITEWDKLVDAIPSLEEAREMGTDLLLLSIILNKSHEEGEEFLDTEEWEAFEGSLDDRGTELMSILTYLADCRENDVKPELGDFLHEFILDSDEQDQDEYFVYEEFLKHEDLLEASIEDIIRAGNGMELDMGELFTPLMLFFKWIEEGEKDGLPEVLKKSEKPAIHAAILFLLHRLERTSRIQIS